MRNLDGLFDMLAACGAVQIRGRSINQGTRNDGLRSRRLSGIFERFDDAIVMADQDFCVRYVNPAVMKITGYRPEQVLEKPMGVFMQPVDHV